MCTADDEVPGLVVTDLQLTPISGERHAQMRRIVRIVGDEFGVDPSRLLSGRDRRFLTLRARYAAIHLTSLSVAQSYAMLGRAFKADHTTVVYARTRTLRDCNQCETFGDTVSI